MMSRPSSSWKRSLFVLASAFFFVSALIASSFDDKKAPAAASVNARLPASYQVSAGLDGEVFPVFANYASLRSVSERRWGTVAVRVVNPGPDRLRNRIAVTIPGWSDQEIQLAELGPGESHTYVFAPTFLSRLYQNREIVAATVAVDVSDLAGKTLHQETVPVRLRSVDDLYWGRDFEYASFIASWVTPHDVEVERLLGRAKEFATHRRLPGYETDDIVAQQRSTVRQARAIYRALQEQGVSYVKSSATFGRHPEVSERIRMPGESLRQVSANCIDGAVMYAALFENLGMDPEILIMPGHAVVGVRTAPASKEFLYIETSLTGRSSFEQAVAAASRSLAKFPKAQVIRIDIRQARRDGIYPMPSGNFERHDRVLEAGKKSSQAGS